jgi:hypothetical protein
MRHLVLLDVKHLKVGDFLIVKNYCAKIIASISMKKVL